MESNSHSEQIRAHCNIVRQTAYAVHLYLGHGHFEKVYENALCRRLKERGLRIDQQFPIEVWDEDGTAIGYYIADLVVEGYLVVELKSVRTLAPEHLAQLLGYLKSTRKTHGLLINFGSYKFQIRKLILTPPKIL